MKLILTGAVLSTALLTNAMHVSSDDESKRPTRPALIAMTNFAAKPPAKIAQDSSSDSSSSQEEQKEPKPICIGNMNKKPTGLYSHLYTLASVDKKN